MRTQALFVRLGAALVALVPLISSGRAHAQYDNRSRYRVISDSLERAAPDDSELGAGLAGAVFDTQVQPLMFRRYDTPDNASFGPEASVNFIWGPKSSGLGNNVVGWALGQRCNAADGRAYGTRTDLRYYQYTGPGAVVAFPACATNTHLAYNDLLRDVQTCGNQCFVDIASLSNIDVIRTELRASIGVWLAGKPDDARLILRITEGFWFSRRGAISGEVDFFSSVVRAGAGKVQVYGIPLRAGAAIVGRWSHAKLFGVFDISNRTYRTMIGGQNHWTDYDAVRPPFDSNTVVTGRGATAPSLQVDGALRWFDARTRWLGRAVWFDGTRVRNTSFQWGTAGYGNVSLARFSGITNVNPRTVPPPAANQRAMVSLIDMGDFSVRDTGRTISRSLHDLIAAEPRTNGIRVWNQTLCRPDHFFDGNCGGRNAQTPMGALVERAMTAARQAWASNVRALTSASSIRNDGYSSASARDVRRSLFATGEAIACNGKAFLPAWAALRVFNNPGGGGNCRAGVVRAIEDRFHWRMARAFINGNGFVARQAVGLHHKLVLFSDQAMFQGSYNLYQSDAGSFAPYDSKLVENGAILLDPGYTADQARAFDDAWSAASTILGGM
jgi:hypothetical protein